MDGAAGSCGGRKKFRRQGGQVRLRHFKQKRLNRGIISLAAAVVAAFGAVDRLEQGQFVGGAGLTFVSLALCCYVIYLSNARWENPLFRRSRLESWDYRLTREGIFYLLTVVVIGVAALLSGNNLLYLILSCLLAAMLVSGLVSRLVLSGLQLDVHLPDAIFARQPFRVSITLHNLKRRLSSYSIWISTATDSGLRRRDARTASRTANAGPPLDFPPVYCPLILGGAKAAMAAPAVFPRRGRFANQVFWLRTRFPLSLVERRVRVAPTKEITVYPSVERTPAVEKMLDGLAAEQRAHARGESHDLYRIRPGEAREGARFVDWKATARARQVMVREFTRDDRKQVEIVFDPTLPGYSRTPAKVGDAAFEETVQHCAAFLWRLSEDNAEIRFLSGGFQWVSAAPSDVFAILGFLAGAQPERTRNRSEAMPVHHAANGTPRFVFRVAEETFSKEQHG